MSPSPDQTMRALVLRAPRQFAIEDVPVPRALDPEDVLCRVETTFICGTDPHIINGDFPGFWPPAFPFIPGHEWSATVVDAGSRAASLGWKAGDRVAAISHCGCGACRNCLRGRYNLCLNYGHPDRGHRQYGHITPGAYAEYVRASVKSLVRVPDGFDLSLAACVDPLSIALYTVKRSRLQPGDDLLVMGAGPQGLMAILIARALGAGRVIAVGSGARLKLARQLGAIPIDYRDRPENPAAVLEQIRELTAGLGVPAIVECAGTAKAMRDCCLAAAKGGVISVIGIPHEDIALPMKHIVLNEIEIIGDRANPNTAQEALALLVNGRVDLTPLLTHRFTLARFAEALETFEQRRDGAVKVAITP
jgi:L-iditol 2-dehydrogenase